MTRDPAAIERTLRPLPICFWKGSGLAVLLDLIASITALGNTTHQIGFDPVRETALSQIFIAIQPKVLGSAEEVEGIANGVVDSLHRAKPVEEGGKVRYPGEETLRIRKENLAIGVPVDEAVWEEIEGLSKA